MPKKQTTYYDKLEGMSRLCCKAAEYIEPCMLKDCLERDDMKPIKILNKEMSVEGKLLEERLIRDFITPIEREDIYVIISLFGELMESIESMVFNLGYLKISVISNLDLSSIKRIKEGCFLLTNMVSELQGGAKSKIFRRQYDEIKKFSREMKEIYRENLKQLQGQKDLFAKYQMSQREERALGCSRCICRIAEALYYVMLKNS